jgi:putative Mn2+ efflux pump MntP
MTLLALSTATSLDALAVGLSLGMLRVGIWVPSVCIGLVAGVVSLVGIRLGKRARRGHGRAAEIAGGAILLLLALQILVTHLSGD